jgi:hypothetical protein
MLPFTLFKRRSKLPILFENRAKYQADLGPGKNDEKGKFEENGQLAASGI